MQHISTLFALAFTLVCLGSGLGLASIVTTRGTKLNDFLWKATVAVMGSALTCCIIGVWSNVKWS